MELLRYETSNKMKIDIDRHDFVTLLCLAFHTNYEKQKLTKEEFTKHIMNFNSDFLFSTVDDMYRTINSNLVLRDEEDNIQLSDYGRKVVDDNLGFA